MGADIHHLRARVLKSLSHPVRMHMVDLLARHGEMCVCALAATVGTSQPMASRHLAVLRDGGLVESRKEGLMVMYRLTDSKPAAALIDAVDAALEADMARRLGGLVRAPRTALPAR